MFELLCGILIYSNAPLSVSLDYKFYPPYYTHSHTTPPHTVIQLSTENYTLYI